ncbi:MAG: ABC transporter permease [Acidimicrobiia bacterium]|nr:ABC transporter permease [Acidimicrobiia bacterium]
MSAFTALAKTQSKVFLREPASVFFALVFPGLLLFVIGTVFPGSTEQNVELGGRSLVEIYAPVSIALGLATVALTILPATLGGDRERGILRRLSATPAHPATLVAVHCAVQLAVVTIATVVAIVVGMVVFGMSLPGLPGWFVVSFVLGALALLSVGLLIGALVSTANSGQAIGMLLYFPLLFFAGVYVPLEVMPEGVRAVSRFTPSGAAVQALSASWAGDVPSTSSLLVMAGVALIAGSLAIWRFRWN